MSVQEPVAERSIPSPWTVRAVRAAYLMSSVLTLTFGLGAVVVVGGVMTHQWQADAVLTGSMNPSIPPKSLILARQYPSEDLHPGQVLMFTAPTDHQERVVHRIVKVGRAKDTGFVQVETKGDANPIADPWKAQIPEDTAWVVNHHVPWVGIVVTNPLVAASLFLSLLLMVFGTSVVLGEWETPEGDPHESGHRAV